MEMKEREQREMVVGDVDGESGDMGLSERRKFGFK